MRPYKVLQNTLLCLVRVLCRGWRVVFRVERSLSRILVHCHHWVQLCAHQIQMYWKAIKSHHFNIVVLGKGYWLHFKEVISNFVRRLTVTMQNSIKSLSPPPVTVCSPAVMLSAGRKIEASSDKDCSAVEIETKQEQKSPVLVTVEEAASTRHLQAVPHSRLTRALRDVTDPRFLSTDRGRIHTFKT